jgi:hypothetical protein
MLPMKKNIVIFKTVCNLETATGFYKERAVIRVSFYTHFPLVQRIKRLFARAHFNKNDFPV